MMDKLKGLFKDPKKRNIMLIGITVVAVLALFALSRRQSGAADAGMVGYASYPESTGGSGGGNSSDSDAAEAVSALSRDFAAAIKKQQEDAQKSADAYNQKLTDIQTGFYGALAGLRNDIYGTLSVFQNDLSGLHESVNAGLLARAQSSSSSYYAYEAPEQYTPVSASTQKPATDTEKIFGVGGADYNKLDAAGKKQMEANEKRIQTDAGYRESEKARTLQVIKNREAAGLDTKAQIDYLNKLNKAG